MIDVTKFDKKSMRLNSGRRYFDAMHNELYPLYETELQEAINKIKDYVNTKEYLKKQKNVKGLIDLITENGRGLRSLTKDINKEGIRFSYPETAVDSIIPIKYGMPIIDSFFEGLDFIIKAINADLGYYSSAKAYAADYEYFFNLRIGYKVPYPDVTMFYPDLEEQDRGLTTSREITMPSMNDTDMVKPQKNGDIIMDVYISYDLNRPRTSRHPYGRKYVIKDGVNRYKKACEQWEADKKAWHKKAIQEFKQENKIELEKNAHRLDMANDTIMALDTVMIPMSILCTLIGGYHTGDYGRNRLADKFLKYYSYIDACMNRVVKLNTIKYAQGEQLTKEDLATLNDIARRYTSRYGHERRADMLEYELKQEQKTA